MESMWFGRGKLFPESTVRNITIQVMNGLAFMHKHGQSFLSSACIAFSLFDFWVASFDGPVPFLAAWLLFPKEMLLLLCFAVCTLHIQGGPKNGPNCFCQNFIKSLIIFGKWIAETIKLCEVHSLSTLSLIHI